LKNKLTSNTSSASIFQQFFFPKQINPITSPLNKFLKSSCPLPPLKSKKVPKSLLKNEKKPHPLPLAKVKNGNKSLTHNTKN
jgi:hypothetical protein